MTRPDVIVLMTDQERATPPYETDEVRVWRRETLRAEAWFDDHAVNFRRHYTGSLACVPSRPTLFTGQYPDVHGVTQTNGLGKMDDDTRMRWLREGEVPTLGHWFRAGGYDTHYVGKWHITHADLTDPETGGVLLSHGNDGTIRPEAVQAYVDADVLDPFGFSDWVGPEPHGGEPALSGMICDGIYANRAIEFLQSRYARRAEGDEAALRPFLLVVSFVNPHDIVFAPGWLGRFGPDNPFVDDPLSPPDIPESPTDREDLSTKPAAQIAFRASYLSTYGPAPMVEAAYKGKAQEYRNLYYRLHVASDRQLDRVREVVVTGGGDALLVRTADHGELLGAHGGLHQKWFNLYDEATRVPFAIARTGAQPTAAREVVEAPTSHVDLVPTLLGAAGIDVEMAGAAIRDDFSEFHALPGRDLMPVVDGDNADVDRIVYAITRDNMPEGDTGASAMARRIGRVDKQPPPLRIQVPAHAPANFESIVSRVAEDDAAGGGDRLWKIVRSFDDPDTWTEPGVRHLASTGVGGDLYRTEPLPDQWELYDLDADPIEAENRWNDPDTAAVFALLVDRVAAERTRAVPTRNKPWPYATRAERTRMKTPPAPARALRKLLQRAGMHPEDTESIDVDLAGRRALVIATNRGVLDVGKPTGVFASEMTVPYYAFLDAGMDVDVASPAGGTIPVDPQSLRAPLRTEACDRFLADDEFRAKTLESLAVADVDIADYDILCLAGGWGAAFDLGFSDELGAQMTQANANGAIIGGVCHGPLGLLKATASDGSPLVAGRKVTAVTDKQVRELGIMSTPHHPETELRKLGAEFESQTRRRDPLANHWVVDGNLVTGQNQNAAPMVAREMLRLAAERAS
ncbi:MAG: sulfatase-like hydrolase/transferase [Acidimicrobiales bacterium]|nr:sulfatase-like hydrolase/transferase [Acidimicrobiales bacterium]MDG1876532.1 sulfatase-like hydrolase/transferase [Acidimicrobiales bacterium]